MEKRVRIITENRRLEQKIRLAVMGACRVSDGFADLTVTEVGGRECSYLRIEGEGRSAVCLSIPFHNAALLEAISGRGGNRLCRIVGESAVTLDGERIRLTEIECRLLDSILSGGGEFVSRDTLLREVWGGEATAGVVNVYIHYLRQKLERGGERIILSSRLGGYKINGKFIGGGDE